jgi:hypothetical protein
MTNAQMWGAVALLQVLQFFLPAGEIFNPILHGLLKAMFWIESETLIQTALYTQTTQLVDYIRNRPGFNGTVRITGHSLGGGTSLITVSVSLVEQVLLPSCRSGVHIHLLLALQGAQTNIPAIAVSGTLFASFPNSQVSLFHSPCTFNDFLRNRAEHLFFS